MKNLIILVFCVIMMNVSAKENEQKTITQSGNDNNANICAPKIIVQPAKSCNACNTCQVPKVITKYKVRKQYVTKTVVKEVVKEVPRKLKRNRIKLLGGYGPTGVDVTRTATRATVREVEGLVLGLSYDRLITETISLGVQAQTNETYLVSVGFDF